MALPHQVLPPASRRPASIRTDDVKTRIDSIWQLNLPMMRARLDCLAAVSAAAATHTLSSPDRDEAISIAHKLAGSLGMFGFPEGTVLARRLEAALSAPAPEADTLAQLTAELRSALRLAA